MSAFTFAVLLFGAVGSSWAMMIGMIGNGRLLLVGAVVLLLCLTGLFQMAGVP